MNLLGDWEVPKTLHLIVWWERWLVCVCVLMALYCWAAHWLMFRKRRWFYEAERDRGTAGRSPVGLGGNTAECVTHITHPPLTGWRGCHHIAGVSLYYWPSHLSKLAGSWIGPLSLQTSFSLFYFIPFSSAQFTSLTLYWLELSNADLISVTFLGRRLSYFITWTWKFDNDTKFDVELGAKTLKVQTNVCIITHFCKYYLRFRVIY